MTWKGKGCLVCMLRKQAQAESISPDRAAACHIVMGAILVAGGPGNFRQVITEACDPHRAVLICQLGELIEQNGLPAQTQRQYLGCIMLDSTPSPAAGTRQFDA